MDRRRKLRRRSQSDNQDIALRALTGLGRCVPVGRYASSGASYYGDNGRIIEGAAVNHVTNPDFSKTLAEGHFKTYPVTDVTIEAQKHPPVALPKTPLGTKQLTMAGKFTFAYDSSARRVLMAPGTAAGISVGDFMAGIAYVYVESMGDGGSLTVDVDVYNGGAFVRTVSSTPITAASTGFAPILVTTTCGAGETACYTALTFDGASCVAYVTAVDNWALTAPTPYLRTYIDETVSNVTDKTTYYSAATQSVRVPANLGASGTIAARIWLPIKGDSGKLLDSLPLIVRNAADTATQFILQRQATNVYNFKIFTGATATISSSAMNFEAYTAHSVCLRWDAGRHELDWDADNVSGDHALAIDARIITLGTTHAFRSLIASPEYKDDAWVSSLFADSGAVFYDWKRLWTSLSPGDCYWPLMGDNTGYRKVATDG